MRLLKGKEIPITICISYTIISVSTSILEMCMGISVRTHSNTIVMLIWTSIAVGILSLHYLFEKLSPILMIFIQYILAMGLVFLTVLATNLLEPISEGGLWDVFLSFSIPYAIGAVLYYISVFSYAKRQNKLLEEIQAEGKGDR